MTVTERVIWLLGYVTYWTARVLCVCAWHDWLYEVARPRWDGVTTSGAAYEVQRWCRTCGVERKWCGASRRWERVR